MTTETLTRIPHKTTLPTIPQNTEDSRVAEFLLGSPMALDYLDLFFDNLRVNSLHVDIKYSQDSENPACVRVEFPLPVLFILNSRDLATLNGIVISQNSKI